MDYELDDDIERHMTIGVRFFFILSQLMRELSQEDLMMKWKISQYYEQ